MQDQDSKFRIKNMQEKNLVSYKKGNMVHEALAKARFVGEQDVFSLAPISREAVYVIQTHAIRHSNNKTHHLGHLFVYFWIY